MRLEAQPRHRKLLLWLKILRPLIASFDASFNCVNRSANSVADFVAKSTVRLGSYRLSAGFVDLVWNYWLADLSC